MFSKITSALMIGALALTTAMSTPALARDRSDNRNLAVGIALGAIVGAAIASNNKQQNNGGYRDNGGYQNNRTYRDYDGRNHKGDDRGYDKSYGHRGHDNGRGGYGNNYGRAQRVNLPGACRVYAGNRAGYSGRCLSQRYGSYNVLPSACAVRVGGHHQVIYRDHCLNQYGYY
ncbi:MAG: hypothetical protein H5U14_02915 [Roseovarius sp.]|nr:hypothetical protein [Roseovarius sp.]